MKLQGLSKYLTQTLGMQVVKPDSFETLVLAPELSTAKFHENISDFGIAYGLGAQLLDEAKIHTNLLPRKIARAMAWTRKSRMFTIAACILLFVSVLAIGTTYKTLKQYQGHKTTRARIQEITRDIRSISDDISTQKARREPLEEKIKKLMDAFQYRDVVPFFIETLAKCLPSKEYNQDQAALYEAFASGTPPIVARDCEGDRLVTQYDAGRCYEPLDGDEMAAAILELSENKDVYRRVRENCIKLSSRFDRSTIAKRTSDILTAVAEDNPLPEVTW